MNSSVISSASSPSGPGFLGLVSLCVCLCRTQSQDQGRGQHCMEGTFSRTSLTAIPTFPHSPSFWYSSVIQAPLRFFCSSRTAHRRQDLTKLRASTRSFIFHFVHRDLTLLCRKLPCLASWNVRGWIIIKGGSEAVGSWVQVPGSTFFFLNAVIFRGWPVTDWDRLSCCDFTAQAKWWLFD